MANVDDKLHQKVISTGYKASEDELERVRAATQIERDWWGDKPAYQDYAEICLDVEKGALVRVEETLDYLPAMRFRNTRLNEQYPPFLEFKTKLLLDELSRDWRKMMELNNQPEEIRVAVANLTITQTYQEKLAKSGKLAIIGNPHVRGVAFDIDASAYYFGHTPVNSRKIIKDKVHKHFADSQAEAHVPEYRNFDDILTRKPLEFFGQVLHRATQDGKLNYVLEYPGTENASYHICRNPNYHPKA